MMMMVITMDYLVEMVQNEKTAEPPSIPPERPGNP
jgi:hypothetical protein